MAALPRSVLVSALGPTAGGHLFAVVHGGTGDRVVVGPRRGSVGAQRALGHGPHPSDAVRAALLGLVDRAGRRMRKAHYAARTVVLRLRFDDYGRATRSRTLIHPTTSGELLAATAVALLDAATPLIRVRGLTLVGVALTELSQDAYLQGTLDLAPDRTGLHTALDAVAARFGTDSVTGAALLRTGAGWAAPVLDQ